MHITVVVAGLGAGGAERVIALLSAAWVADGRRVTVIAFDAPGDPVYHRFDAAVQLIRLGRARRRGVAGAIAKTWRLRAALRELRPDVVIGFLTKVNAMTLLATIGLGVRVIVSERNNPKRQQAHHFWGRMLGKLYARADAIVLQTETSRECLPPLAARMAVVIPNPITLPDAAPPAFPPRVIAAVGRLEHQKGFDLLIAAFAAVAPHHPDWRLVIWGEGPRRADLTTQIARAGMAGRIVLPGLSETPGSWLGRTAAFALSSRYEGFPNALGEAMAAGLPVIAFNCPYGPADMISPGVDGLLIAEGDTAAYSVGLKRLMGDSAYRMGLGLAAKRRVSAFNSVNISSQWLRTIDNVLNP